MGNAVSVTCRNDLGSYQGQICNVDPKEQTITLKKAFKNGIPCQVPKVTLRLVKCRRNTHEHVCFMTGVSLFQC